MSAEDRLRSFADSEVPPPTPVHDLRARITRRRRRRRFVGATAAVLLVAGLALAVALGDDSDQLDTIDDATSTTDESSTSVPSTTTTVIHPGSADPDAAAAADFLDAWSRGDREAMLEVADPQAVDLALDYFGSPASDLDCITQTNGQLDCEVKTTSGRWAYFLIGQPGAADGRIWWLSETAPGEGGGP
jgi:hypothetical protein